MLNRLNHVAIAVPDLGAAVTFYRDVLGAEVSEAMDLWEHGVTSVFVYLSNTKLELITPLGDHSPIAGFLTKNPAGGLHHLCFEVQDIHMSSDKVNAAHVRLIDVPKQGSQGKPVVFMHPKDVFGCLLELEESA
ncbi:MAG: methylmalonyl-CoA epimerase [Alphaproteobacteria bacterium]|jgi:methylmalonyl-CoA/ethylmalonyl-CoA epimerase|nr:methylmalonyl-CoA epimerase [Alphaproteobacteria bacterium]